MQLTAISSRMARERVRIEEMHENGNRTRSI